MIPVPQGAKTSDVSPDYATDRLIISPDKLLFMFITPDESIHKSLHVTYSVIQNKKKQQKKNKSPDVNLSDLKLFIYINLRITKPLKRRFLRTLSFFSFFSTDTLQSVFPPHMSACQQRLKSDPSLFSRCWRILCLINWIRFFCHVVLCGNIQMRSCNRLLVKFSRESWPSLYVPPALCFTLYAKNCICFTRFDSFLTLYNLPWTPRLITLHYTTLSGINHLNHLKQISFLIWNTKFFKSKTKKINKLQLKYSFTN